MHIKDTRKHTKDKKKTEVWSQTCKRKTGYKIKVRKKKSTWNGQQFGWVNQGIESTT